VLENSQKTQFVEVSEFDNTDQPINPDRFDQNLVYTSGDLTSIWFTDYKNTWTKTLTYSGGVLVKTSRWIRS
jgi:hypothetical protein